jgi:exopolysaccharide biosynthesis polyprenyl glycosylphosphotransferase
MAAPVISNRIGLEPDPSMLGLQPPPHTLANMLRRDPWHTIVTLVVDVAAAALAIGAAHLWSVANHVDRVPGWLPWLFIPYLLLMLASQSQYRRSLRRNFLDEIGPLEASIGLAALLWLTTAVLIDTPGRPGETSARLWICAAILIPLARLGRAVVQRILRQRFRSAAPTLIIGDGPVSHQVISRMQQMPEYGLLPVGILSASSAIRRSNNDLPNFLDVPRLGSPAELGAIADAVHAEELIVGFCDDVHFDDIVAAVRAAQKRGMRVWAVPRLHDAVGDRARIEHLGGLPLLVLPHVNPLGWQFWVKGFIDRVLTSLGLLAISPIFLTLALLVRLSSPGPILFKQKRVGRDGKPFDCYKFRSMRPPRASDAQFELKAGSAPGGVEGVDRRTKIGKIMRQTSLDELPQLLNVIKGDMSLVGPRPERPEFVELFEAQIRRYGERHRVKAGVTGWAQVHGLRGQTSIADRAEWDNYYIENWSIWLDVKILFLTVRAVLTRAED